MEKQIFSCPCVSSVQFYKITEKRKYSSHMSSWQLSGRKSIYKNRMQCLSHLPPLARNSGARKAKDYCRYILSSSAFSPRGPSSKDFFLANIHFKRIKFHLEHRSLGVMLCGFGILFLSLTNWGHWLVTLFIN